MSDTHLTVPPHGYFGGVREPAEASSSRPSIHGPAQMSSFSRPPLPGKLLSLYGSLKYHAHTLIGTELAINN
ncbi:hypothetical protein N7495_001483 [Penicillium taxi]|uniref:uncharacterized protein n=1 Tax=Penicillium taxi TaxID=168475 RepID=UPI00254579D2|nr:uncharacterized protein N7495_001483 [Penicillium taxi]KAJ5908801.1 hypothetical protein N7495_001483 [Penicillium taxi]